jgi:hypothetical protein
MPGYCNDYHHQSLSVLTASGDGGISKHCLALLGVRSSACRPWGGSDWATLDVPCAATLTVGSAIGIPIATAELPELTGRSLVLPAVA